MAHEVAAADVVQAALLEACPGIRVDQIRPLEAGYTSRQWVATTDEGPLLVKTPIRQTDPEHLRRLIATTRQAAEGGVPVVRFRAFLPRSRAFEAPLVVQEFQEGVPADELWPDMDGAERLAFVAELGELVGRLHSCSGPWFGDVLGNESAPDLRTILHARVDVQLASAPPDFTSLGRDGLAAVLHRVIDTVPMAVTPSLTHGDLWRPNVVLRGGRIVCLLDFEHGGYSDRFLDFSKLDEHIFTEFPQGRPAFLEAYDRVCPLPEDWEPRVRFGHALHALAMGVYFLQWTPEYAPDYIEELEQWLRSQD